jgi:hypothetical protein
MERRRARRKEEGGRRKEEGGRRKEEGGRRKEEGGRRKEEGNPVHDVVKRKKNYLGQVIQFLGKFFYDIAFQMSRRSFDLFDRAAYFCL